MKKIELFLIRLCVKFLTWTFGVTFLSHLFLLLFVSCIRILWTKKILKGFFYFFLDDHPLTSSSALSLSIILLFIFLIIIVWVSVYIFFIHCGSALYFTTFHFPLQKAFSQNKTKKNLFNNFFLFFLSSAFVAIFFLYFWELLLLSL